MKSQALKKAKLPDAPGVYFFKDAKGRTLYIGRATSLRDRVRSYFAADVISTRGSRIVDMVTRSAKVAFERSDSVLEAIILEANLIKRFQPRYNIDEKDDKSWNYVGITDEDWPRVVLVRGRNLEKAELEIRAPTPREEPEALMTEGLSERGGARRSRAASPAATAFPRAQGSGSSDKGHNVGHQKSLPPFKKIFGPYPAGGLLRDALKVVRRIFPYLDEKSLDPKHRAFYASIGLAPAVPSGASAKEGSGGISSEEYRRNIRHLTLFLEGRKKALIKDLKKEMMAYANEERFELADKAKRTIYALEHIEDVALIKDDKAMSGGFRIEAYDIAHLSGTNVVGVMTVVVDGEPAKGEYRKFKVSRDKNDDAAALREILLRRLGHPEWPYPSLIVVDGGQAQLNVALKVLAELKSDIAAVALVKDDKHKARGIVADEALTKKNPTLLSQYKRAIILANSEAHRFAVAYHKNRRAKGFLGR